MILISAVEIDETRSLRVINLGLSIIRYTCELPKLNNILQLWSLELSPHCIAICVILNFPIFRQHWNNIALDSKFRLKTLVMSQIDEVRYVDIITYPLSNLWPIDLKLLCTICSLRQCSVSGYYLK